MRNKSEERQTYYSTVSRAPANVSNKISSIGFSPSSLVLSMMGKEEQSTYTVRAAVENANACDGSDVIVFSVRFLDLSAQHINDIDEQENETSLFEQQGWWQLSEGVDIQMPWLE